MTLDYYEGNPEWRKEDDSFYDLSILRNYIDKWLGELDDKFDCESEI